MNLASTLTASFGSFQLCLEVVDFQKKDLHSTHVAAPYSHLYSDSCEESISNSLASFLKQISSRQMRIYL